MASKEQIKAWLNEAEEALHALYTGQSVVSMSHSNDAGSRAMAFKQGDEAKLERYIAKLKQQLCLTPARAPIVLS